MSNPRKSTQTPADSTQALADMLGMTRDQKSAPTGNNTANNNAKEVMEPVGKKSTSASAIEELAHYLLFVTKEVPVGNNIKDSMEVALQVAKRRLEAQEEESSKVRIGHTTVQYGHRMGWNNKDEAPVESAPMTEADCLQAAEDFLRS